VTTAQGRGKQGGDMLVWKETVKAVVVADLDGYTYTITQDDEGHWAVEIETPDEGVDYEVFATIEEAKEYCERTAAAVQSEES
jgi:hypothetical protein